MGDRGRLVVPVELRERLDLKAGSTLLLLETPEGIIVATRDQAKRLIRHQLQGGGSVVDELAAERRLAADTESHE